MKAAVLLRAGRVALLAIACATLVAAPAVAQDEPPKQFVDVKGEFIRLGYNQEGWVVLGYRTANDSVGDEWMLLEVGITLMSGVKDQDLTREELSVISPDGSVVIPLASQEEFSQANLRSLDAKANMSRDSVNYFPVSANTPCRIGFFTDVGQPGRGMAYDTVELSWNRACAGRLYFKVPGGIQYGRYFLRVQFDGGPVEVPFGIMTKEELKENKKKWNELQKQLKAQAKQEKQQG